MKGFLSYIWRAGNIEMLCFVVAFAILARATSPWPLRIAIAAFVLWLFANVYTYKTKVKGRP